MPFYEYECSNCGFQETIFMSFGEYDRSKDIVVCEMCYKPPCEPDGGYITYMRRIYSTGTPLVYKTFGHKVDTEGIKMPKAWFKEQQRLKQDKNERAELDSLIKNPRRRKFINNIRKSHGESSI